MVPGVIRCGELESGVSFPKNPLIGRELMEIEVAENYPSSLIERATKVLYSRLL